MRKNISATDLVSQLQHSLRPLALTSLCLLLSGCPASKPGAESSLANAPASDATKVVIRGSNTIGEELAPGLIAEFKKTHPTISFDVETKATGYGMAALRVGQCDIAAASRPAIQADLDLAKDANLEMNDTVLGAYSVAVVVHPNNPVVNLTKDQVRGIFTGKVQNWKDVGGPDAAIHLYIRDPISGTHLGFKEIAMNNDEYALHPKLLTNYTALATAVATDSSGIGYSGIEMAKATGAKLVSIDGVEASDAAVHSGKYPYARLLRFYTNKARESQATKDFIAFTLSARGQELIRQMGFTPKP
jgi:phosphate transport system substrate-binding protein